MGVLPGAEPYSADGGPTGVVLVHGFTGSPHSMRPWAQHLAAAGYTVAVPRLPGHGTTWREMNRTRWTDWYGEVERAFDDLRGRCAEVFATGLSMGGTLALRLAEQRAAEVAGLVLVNPSLGSVRRGLWLAPALSRVVPAVRGVGSDIKKPGVRELSYDWVPLRAFDQLRRLWAVVGADLGRVTAPTLVYRSRVDHVVEPLSGRLLRDGCRSCGVEERLLDDSYHVATLDNDAPTIFAGSVDWITRHSRLSAAPTPAGAVDETAGG